MSVALVIQHAMRMRPFILVLPSVACLTVPYFFHIISQRHDFREKLLNLNVCFDFLYNIFLKKRRTDMIYLLSATELSAGGSTHLHTNNT